MAQQIDYFYTHISPWAYLGHAAFIELASRHGVKIRPRPVDLSGVFEATGGLPVAKRHPARQQYRWVELQRWQQKRGIKLTFRPKHFPTSPRLADCCAIALASSGQNVLGYSAAVFRAIWSQDQDISRPETLKDILTNLGFSADPLLAEAGSEAVAGLYAQNQTAAIEMGVIGSPCYVLNGEPFWGQDRLDLLEDALRSGRPPFRPL